MVSQLGELELQCIDLMSRPAVLDAIRRLEDSLPPDLRGRLDEQPTRRLQLLLLTARLVWALRRTRSQDWAEDAPHAGV